MENLTLVIITFAILVTCIIHIRNTKKQEIYAKIHGTDVIIKLTNLPLKKGYIAFWAASKTPDDKVYMDGWHAYKNSLNSGLRPIIDSTGVIDVKCPSRYAIPKKNIIIPKHVHYALYTIDGKPFTKVRSISLDKYC